MSEKTRQSPLRRGITITAIILLLIASGFAVFGIPGRSSESVEGSRFLLDTVVSIRIYTGGDEELLEVIFDAIADFESELSRHQDDSDISRVNRASGNPMTVSQNVGEVLSAALKYAEMTNGAFDPTVGPLVDLWDIGGSDPGVPEEQDLAAALELVDYRKVLTDESGTTVSLELPDMELDLGGVAKGWIADRVADELASAGVGHLLINLGGNVLVSGGKPDGEPFRIGMQDPQDERGVYLGVFSIHDGSVVSSGVYERYFVIDDVRYHHILDTDSGYPVDNGLLAVTVISDLSVDGDALSTALFALGMDEGLALADRLDGIEAAFVTTDGEVVMTSGAAGMFEPARTDLKMTVYP